MKMNHSAKDLFPDWYAKGLKKEVSSEELNSRRTTIERLLKQKELNFWLDTVKVYYGILGQESSIWTELAVAFKEDDINFPLQQNENILRLLSGSLLSQKIELNDSWNCDAIALSLTTTSFLTRTGELPLNEVHELAVAHWLSECEAVRKMDLEFKSEKEPVKWSTGKINIPPVQGIGTNYAPDFVSAGNLKPTLDSITAHLASLQKDVLAANQTDKVLYTSLESIKSNLKIISEETNILWWLFGGFSNTLCKSLSTLPLPLASTIIGKELHDLTYNLPGLGHVTNIINKSLSQVSSDFTKEFSFADFIESLKEIKDFVKFFPPVPETLFVHAPCLNAIRCFYEFKDGDWMFVFKKKGIVDPKEMVTPLDFSTQIYKELMLFKVCNEVA
jgi:hypothetical protein